MTYRYFQNGQNRKYYLNLQCHNTKENIFQRVVMRFLFELFQLSSVVINIDDFVIYDDSLICYVSVFRDVNLFRSGE